jgi:hypothetical protein
MTVELGTIVAQVDHLAGSLLALPCLPSGFPFTFLPCGFI